ncbi:MAG: NosD domain-containing protein [Promethearchaeota archaeon]
MRKIVLMCLIVAILLCSIGTDRMVTSDHGEQKMNIISAEIYLPHDPINITSNDGFISEGWMGEGTAENPYTIEQLEFTNSTEVNGPCISVSNTTAFFKIINCVFNTTTFASAIALDNVTNGLIQNCSTEDYVWGILVNNCSLIQFLDLTLTSCIIVDNSSFCSVIRCSIRGAPGDGIDFTKCNNMTIQGCDIWYCAASGIYLDDTNNTSIIGNKIEAYDYCIFIYGSSSNNWIFNNVMIPIEPYYIALGRDDGITNYWDDGVSTGNWWSDYDESGDYDIYGTAGSVDHYPMGHSSVLLVDHCNERFQFAAIVSISWNAFSEVPDHFIIYKNGEIHESDVWDGDDISTSVVTDTLGIFNYTIFVNGTSGNYKTDTVMVEIYNNVPTIDSPNDISYIHGATGNFIEWIASDDNPARYEIYRNATLDFSDTWDGSPVSFSVDGLEIGVYNYTIVVFDTCDQTAYNTVFVTVQPSTTIIPTTTTTTSSGTDTPSDNALILAIGIGSVVVTLIVVVLVFKKKG